MKYERIFLIIAAACMLGIAVFMNNLGPYRAWLGIGFMALGVVLFVVGLVQAWRRARETSRVLPMVATVALGTGVLLVGADMLWPSYGLDKPGYGLLLFAIIFGSWPRKPAGR